jgi:hypothetical protein
MTPIDGRDSKTKTPFILPKVTAFPRSFICTLPPSKRNHRAYNLCSYRPHLAATSTARQATPITSTHCQRWIHPWYRLQSLSPLLRRPPLHQKKPERYCFESWKRRTPTLS